MAQVQWTVDEVILVAAEVSKRGWARGVRAGEPEARELSQLLRAAPFHPPSVRGETFRSTGSVQRKSFDLLTSHPDYTGRPTKGGAADRVVLHAYGADPEGLAAADEAIRAALLRGDVPPEDVHGGTDLLPPEVSERPEGRLLWVRHLRRERDPGLRRAKLAAVMGAGGSLACEICGFDFEARYGEVGAGFIEVHHVVPLHHSGPTVTRLADLALLCSNCHSMVHRARPWLTPAELKASIAF